MSAWGTFALSLVPGRLSERLTDCCRYYSFHAGLGPEYKKPASLDLQRSP